MNENQQNKKQWANITVVENGYIIDTYMEKYIASNLKELTEVISRLVISMN